MHCTMCCLDSNVPQCLMYPSSHRVGDTGVHYGAQGRLLGYIFGKITDLEFEIHKNIILYEFLAIERARTNIC